MICYTSIVYYIFDVEDGLTLNVLIPCQLDTIISIHPCWDEIFDVKKVNSNKWNLSIYGKWWFFDALAWSYLETAFIRHLIQINKPVDAHKIFTTKSYDFEWVNTIIFIIDWQSIRYELFLYNRSMNYNSIQVVWFSLICWL